MALLFEDSNKFCIDGVVCRHGKGNMYKCVTRLATHICDRKEAEMLVDVPTQTCFWCGRLRCDNWIPGLRRKDARRYLVNVKNDIQQAKDTGTWPARPGQEGGPDPSAAKIFWCEETQGPLIRCKAALDACCKDLRVTQQSFLGNAYHNIPFFDPYQQLFYETLHNGPLGVWPHLFKAAIYTLKMHLLRWTGHDRDNLPIITPSKWEAVLERLDDRLVRIGQNCKNLAASTYFLRGVGKRMDAANENPGKNTAGSRAAEMNICVLTVVYCLPGLITPELDLIKAHYQEHEDDLGECLERHDEALADSEARRRPAASGARGGYGSFPCPRPRDREDVDSDDEAVPDAQEPDDPDFSSKESFLKDVRVPTDPTDMIVNILFEYGEWSNELRSTRTDDIQLEALNLRIQRWKEMVLKEMPFKGGQVHGWNFIKFEMLNHSTEKIPWIGCLENVSAQTPELLHQKYVKSLGGMVNRQQGWGPGVMLRRAREALTRMLASEPRDGELA